MERGCCCCCQVAEAVEKPILSNQASSKTFFFYSRCLIFFFGCCGTPHNRAESWRRYGWQCGRRWFWFVPPAVYPTLLGPGPRSIFLGFSCRCCEFSFLWHSATDAGCPAMFSIVCPTEPLTGSTSHSDCRLARRPQRGGRTTLRNTATTGSTW